MATGPIMATGRALATTKGRSLITKEVILGNRTMEAGTGMVTMEMVTDCCKAPPSPEQPKPSIGGLLMLNEPFT